MSAAWAAIIIPAVMGVVGGAVAAVRTAYARGAATGRRDGQIAQAIAMLTRITADHEARLRAARL